MTPRERAEEAKRMLDNPAFLAVLDDIRERFVQGLEAAPMGDVDSHHVLALQLQILRGIRTTLRKYADELTVDQHKQREQKFIEKARESLTKFTGRPAARQ